MTAFLLFAISQAVEAQHIKDFVSTSLTHTADAVHWCLDTSPLVPLVSLREAHNKDPYSTSDFVNATKDTLVQELESRKTQGTALTPLDNGQFVVIDERGSRDKTAVIWYLTYDYEEGIDDLLNERWESLRVPWSHAGSLAIGIWQNIEDVEWAREEPANWDDDVFIAYGPENLRGDRAFL